MVSARLLQAVSSGYVLQNYQNERVSETCRKVIENVPIRTHFRPIIQGGTVEVSRGLQPEMLTVERKRNIRTENAYRRAEKKARGRDEGTQHVRQWRDTKHHGIN